MNRTALILEIFDAGIARVRGGDAVRHYLQAHPQIECDHLFAIGKAGAAMASGALAEHSFRQGLVITKHGHLEQDLMAYPHIVCLESDHPVPGPASLDAGQQLIQFLETTPDDASFLALISGGASSLVEALAPGLDLEALRKLTDLLLGEGLDIGQMNAVRRSISRIKGGRLAHYLKGRETCVLLISDVPGDDPAVIGSGPLTPTAREVLPESLSDSIHAILKSAQRMPAPGAETFRQVHSHIIATLDDAKQSAADHARSLDLAVTVHPEFLAESAEATGRRLAHWLISAEAEPGVHIWGGETTVRLPDNPGRGGRNQQLALAAAQVLNGHPDIGFLACGTDGTDGPTEDAGGIVDGTTLARGEALGMDAQDAINRADSGCYLEAVEALVTTGPTGTNVMDLVIALKEA